MEDITSSLNEYSSVVNDYASQISNSLQKVAVILILTFFLLDIFRWNKKLEQEGGSITTKLWFELSIGYIIAWLLAKNISGIFDVIVFVSNKAIHLVQSILPDQTYQATVNTEGIGNWILQSIVQLVGDATQFIADVSAKILVFLRFFQMYILKAVAPIIVALFMSEQTRPITINFLKHFSAYAFQGLLLVIIATLYPALVTEDFFKAGDGDLVAAFASIAKSVVYIIALFGSQRLAKTLLNAM